MHLLIIVQAWYFSHKRMLMVSFACLIYITILLLVLFFIIAILGGAANAAHLMNTLQGNISDKTAQALGYKGECDTLKEVRMIM